MSKKIQAKIINADNQAREVEVLPGAGPAVRVNGKGASSISLSQADKKVAPDVVKTRRVGSDLHIDFLEDDVDNTTEVGAEADLIIENYYDTASTRLVGPAEDGVLYEYVPQTPTTEQTLMGLVDGGGGSAQVLGLPASLAPVAAGLFPAPLALLGGLLGAAALTRTSSGGDAKPTTTDPVIVVGPVPSYGDNVGAIQNPASRESVTDDTTPSINVGKLPAGATPQLFVDGKVVPSKYDAATGTLTPTTALGEGAHKIVYTLVDGSGKPTYSSTPLELTVDKTAPGAPLREGLDLKDNFGAVVGTIVADSLTDDATPTFSGKVTLGEGTTRVNVYDNSVLIGYAPVNGDGSWSFTPTETLTIGSHSFEATAMDSAGNESAKTSAWAFRLAGDPPAAPSINEVMDNQGPIQQALQKGVTTDDTTPTISGTGTAGTTVTVYVNGVASGSAKVGNDGKWSVTVTPELSGDGTKNITARATDAAQQSSPETGIYPIVLDTTPPTKLAAPLATDNAGTATGAIAEGGTTDDATPTFSGSGATPGDTITILDNGKAIGSAMVDKDGKWSFTPTDRLPEGTHAITIVPTDPTGLSGAASDPLKFTQDSSKIVVSITKAIDDKGPITADLANGGATDDDTPTLEGLASPNATVTVKEGTVILGTTTANGSGAWQFTLPKQTHGLHTYTASAANAANTLASASFSIAIDTDAPATPAGFAVTDDVGLIQGPLASGAHTDDINPTFSGTGGTPGDTIRIYDNGALLGEAAVSKDGSWSYTVPKDKSLGQDTHSLTATAVDPVGNESKPTAPYVIVVDTLAPAAPLEAGLDLKDDFGAQIGTIVIDATTDDKTPTYSGKVAAGTDATRVTIYDEGKRIGDTSINSDGSWSFTPKEDLATGKHSFQATAMDAAGNESGKTSAWAFTVGTTVPGITATITAVVDNQEPVLATVAHQGFTNDLTPMIEGTLSQALVAGETLQVFRGTQKLGAAVTSGATWSFQDGGLIHGNTYTYTVHVENSNGTPGPTSNGYDITTDTVAPTQTVVLSRAKDDQEPGLGDIANGGTTNDTSPTLEGTISAVLNGTEQVRILRDGVDVGQAVVTGTDWTFADSNLASGNTYAYRAKVVDAAGNSSTESDKLSFSVDTSGVSQTVSIQDILDDQAPQIGSVANGGETNDLSPLLSGSVAAVLKPGESVDIFRNGQRTGSATVSGTGWTYQDKDLVPGIRYSYTARLINAANAQGPESAAYVITTDTMAPTATVAVVNYTDNSDPLQGDFGSGTSTNDVSPLIRGTVAGALGSGERVLVYRDGAEVGHATLNGDAWTFQDQGLVNGKIYTYTARVVDSAGNQGAVSPKPLEISVDTVAPTATTDTTAVTEDRGTAGDFVTNDASLVISGTNVALSSGERVQVSLDNGVTWMDAQQATATSWNFDNTANPLTEGTHSIKSRVVDTAGNVGSEDTQSLTIDLTAPTQAVIITEVGDNVAPVEGVVIHNGSTNDDSPTVGGTLSSPLGAGERVLVRRDGLVVGEATIKLVTGPNAGTVWEFQDQGLIHGRNYLYTARVVDTAGNEGAVSNGYNINVDTQAPTQVVVITRLTDDQAPSTGTIPNGGATNDSQPTLEGTLTAVLAANEMVVIYRDGKAIGKASVDAGSTSWTLIDSAGGMVNAASYVYTARVEDSAGNTSAFSDKYSISYQSTGPNITATIHAVEDDKLAVTGVVAHLGSTNDDTPLIKGTLSVALTAGQVVKVMRNGAEIGDATVSGTTWNFQDGGLSDGKRYTYKVQVRDSANNAGPDSNAYEINIDTTAPNQEVILKRGIDNFDPVAGDIAEGSVTNDETPTLEGTISGPLSGTETVRIVRNGVEIGTATVSGTSWTYTDASLSSGSKYAYLARVVDAAGNASQDSNALSFTLNTSGVNQTVQILKAVDNTDPQQGDIANGGYTNDGTPAIHGSVSAALGTGEKLEVLRNGVAIGYATVTATTWVYQDKDLYTGIAYTYTARVLNAASTPGALSSAYTIHLDTSAPMATVAISNYTDNTGPVVGNFGSETTTDDTSPLINGTLIGLLESGEQLVVFRNGVQVGKAVVNGTNWSYQDQDLASATTYTYTARVVDAAGNSGQESPAPLKLTVDTSTPTKPAAIPSYGDNVGSVQSATSTASATDDVLPALNIGSVGSGLTPKLYVDGKLVESVYDPIKGTLTPTTDIGFGSHQLSYSLINAAGVEGPKSDAMAITFVGTAAPVVTITSLSDDSNIPTDFVTKNTSSTLKGTFTGVQTGVGQKVQVSLDGGTTWTDAVMGQGTWESATTYAGMQDAAYQAMARVVDATGAVGLAAFRTAISTALGQDAVTKMAASQAVIIDTTIDAPLLSASDNGSITASIPGDDAVSVTYSYSNQADALSTLKVIKKDGVWQFADTAVADVSVNATNGQVIFGDKALADGRKVTATAVDLAGNVSSATSFALGGVQVNSGVVGKNPSETGFDAVATRYTEENPSITRLSNGNLVVVWQDYEHQVGSSYTYWKTYAQILTSGGAYVGGEIELAPTTGVDSWSFNPAVAATPDGGFLVLQQQWYTGKTYDIVARKYSADGGFVSGDGIASWSGIVLNTPTVGNQYAPKLSVLSDGSFVATWIEDYSASVQGDDKGGNAVVTRKFTANGQAVTNIDSVGGKEYSISTYVGDHLDPEIATFKDEANGAFKDMSVIVWRQLDSSVRGQMIRADGSQYGAEFEISAPSNRLKDWEYSPDVTVLKDGSFVVLWSTPEARDGSWFTVLGQHLKISADAATDIAKAGAVVTSTSTVQTEFVVNGHGAQGITQGYQIVPTSVALKDGGYMVFWVSYSAANDPNTYWSIRGQRFNADDSLNGGEFSVSRGGLFNGWYENDWFYRNNVLDAVLNEDGNVAVTWMGMPYNSAAPTGGTASADKYSFNVLMQLVSPDIGSTQTKTVAPVTLDLNQDGVISYSHLSMDVNDDGVVDQTAWVAANDGVLIWDKFGDGSIHDSSQYAFTKYGGSTDLQGLQIAFDSDGNYVLNAKDAWFNQFSVWRDINQNGVSDQGEVKSLAETGITSIYLGGDGTTRQPAGDVVEWGHTTAVLTSGKTMLVADASFAYQAGEKITSTPSQNTPPTVAPAVSADAAATDAGTGYNSTTSQVLAYTPPAVLLDSQTHAAVL